GKTINAKVDSRFGRAPFFVILDTQTLGYKFIENVAAQQSSGAGTKAAEMLINEGIEALISSNLGPNAMSVIKAAKIPVYKSVDGDIKTNLELFQNNKLEKEF
ncbi:MAG: NifB/NifX family molybdenum-iron cluster-binding protein, partial [Thermoanaerobacteraceae bacterium]